MTRPTDASIARAFWEARERAPWSFELACIIDRAAEYDAEAGGTDRQTEEVMQIEPTPGRPVASAADGKAAAPLMKCPRCPALMPPGLSCKGNPPDDPCPLRPA